MDVREFPRSAFSDYASELDRSHPEAPKTPPSDNLEEDAIEICDELKAGSHKLARFYDNSEPPWSKDSVRWRLTRTANEGETVVMEGVGYSWPEIKVQVNQQRLSRKTDQVNNIAPEQEPEVNPEQQLNPKLNR
jgi:hypothetical protein